MLGLASPDFGIIREKKKKKRGTESGVLRGWLLRSPDWGLAAQKVQRGSDKEGERRSVRLSTARRLGSCQLGGGPGFVAETVF